MIKQEPRNGYLSANDTVRLYVTRPDPRYGLLPNLVGSSVDRSTVAAPDAQGPDDDHLREGADGIGARAEAGARRRRRQGPQGDADRRPRDAQRESLIT